MTVAGRDGAGRLGQESEELRISLKGACTIIISINCLYALCLRMWVCEGHRVGVWGCECV